MFLKSIEVQGFKSFANKLTFEFHKGITGIVGPNGSGKSNVGDAVRWVLGEQSAKQLRGSRMEDVIFSGTELRKPLGFAYVAITLDNSDHQLAIEYDTVTVSRRVYRSGESEYKINGHTCRLKDIQELFFDTGIGKEGYSIIGQGQIDKILSSKPDDRRELFDEAVGIVKYKKRKALTQKNLETEELNLSRIKDILYELEKQKGPLEKQSEAAKIYLDYRETLKKYDAASYVTAYTQLKSEIAESDSKILIAQDQLSEAQQQFEKIRQEYDQMEKLIEQYDEKLSELREKDNALSVEKQRIEGQIELTNSHYSSSSERITLLLKNIDDLKQRLESKKKEIKSQEAVIRELEEKIAGFESTKDQSESRLKAMSGMVEKLRNEIEDHNGNIIDCLNRAANAKAVRQRHESMLEQFRVRQSEQNSQLISLQSASSDESSLVESFQNEAAVIEEDLKKVQQSIETTGARSKKISEQILILQDRLNKKERLFHEESSKYNTLKNITERYDGYGVSIKRVMEQKKSNKGILGVVADIIHVSKAYEIAIETALGGSISNIVTDNENTAKRMIEYLKRERFGRATFLPLTSIKGRVDDRKDRVCQEKGVIGIACDLIETPPQYKNLSIYLLGRIYVVDHIDNALRIASKYNHALRIVTLEGESLNPGGSISGGAYKNSSNLLSRRREMEDLEKSIGILKEEGEEIRKQIGELTAKRESGAKDLEKLSASEKQLSLRKNTVAIRMKQVSDSQAEHESAIEDIRDEIARLLINQADVIELIEKDDREIEDIELSQETSENAIRELTKKLEETSSKEKDYTEETSDIRIRYSQLRQEKEFASVSASRYSSEYEQLQSELSDALQSLELIRKESEAYGESGAKLKEAAEELLVSLEENRKVLDAALEEKNRYSAEHKSFFDKREEISDRISLLDKEVYRLQSQKEKLEEKRKEQSNYMWEEYAMTYQSAKAYVTEDILSESASSIRKTVTDLRQKIRQLGNVNVNAIEEYKEVSARYDEMKTQYDDIVEAEAKLNQIIDSLNTSMSEQFKERFEKIKVEFDRIFKLLFGGGQGTLALTDPDNLLETGISITAQPPGKKLQNMLQLSGGEKALTAISLLFAIQSLKPSPFCLLDEIEAALDDANVKRFAEYLHKLTKDTQFIVITHRRGTMNAADILYGITMQEKGVSTLVSVSLVEDQLT